jgi:hypothetical protein
MNFHALTPYWITRAGGIKANAALEMRDRPNYDRDDCPSQDR